MSETERMTKLEDLHRECAVVSPLIVTDSALAGGLPHIHGTTVTVSEIIDRLYVHGSISAVISYYDDLTEEQIKDALAFTTRLMELIYISPENKNRGGQFQF